MNAHEINLFTYPFSCFAPQNGKSCCDYPSACGVSEPESSIESNDFNESDDVNTVEKQQEEEDESKSSGDEEQNMTSSRGSSKNDERDEDDEDMK